MCRVTVLLTLGEIIVIDILHKGIDILHTGKRIMNVGKISNLNCMAGILYLEGLAYYTRSLVIIKVHVITEI